MYTTAKPTIENTNGFCSLKVRRGGTAVYYEQLHKEDNGLFSTAQAPAAAREERPQLIWKSVEKSNVDMVDEMTAMMTSQRALQSAAQVLKMYDQIMSKSVTDVGRL